MTRYLISIYQPDGPPPPPEILEPVMREIAQIRQELDTAGQWVFGDGLHPPSTATVVRATGDDVPCSALRLVRSVPTTTGVIIATYEPVDRAVGAGV